MEAILTEDSSFQGESERNEIRSKLSKMSFEDLRKLKEKIGSKVYKEAMFGTRSVKETTFKRANKNRPREVSSKVKPDFLTKKKKKEKQIIDPRFNRLCGDFNERHFQNTYDFLTDIRKREKEQLKKMLKKESDPQKVEQISYLIQRMENQEREEKNRNKKLLREAKEKEEQIKALESGKKPYFKTKYEKKIVDLVEKFDDLKKTGKVQKYIEKKNKKQKIKEKKNKRYFEVKID